MNCRPGCAACCIVISISSPLPGMPQGKAAGTPCVNLDEHRRCRLHGSPLYPTVCRRFTPTLEFCGETDQDAVLILTKWERLTL